MKILQIIDKLDIGGAERVFVDMCNILQENGQDVSAMLLLEDRGALASQLKVPIVAFNRKSKWNLVSMNACSKILRQYDVIHCHSKHIFRYIKLVCLLMGVDKKLILQDHSSFKIQGKQLFLFKYLFRPDYYIGVGEAINQHAINKVGIPQKNVFLLENIILKSDSSIKFSFTDFILVSNIKTTKNNLFSLEVLSTFPDKSLRIIGRVQEQMYYDEMQTYSQLNNLTVDFVTTLNEVQPVLKNSSIGLHTSKSETGPLVLIEYLAQGLPFLAYETGEVAKILKPYFPEYFIDNFELEQWVERINQLLEVPADTKKMEEVFEKYFGIKEYYNKLIKIYSCITEG
ncbi:MAG: glycosyltransferase [Flavobacteriaceae bacterium]